MTSLAQPRRRSAIRDNRITEVDDGEVDFELTSPSKFFGSHINAIPLQSAVQGPRLFYGARFYNQAMPIENPEAPLVQNLDDEDERGRSFDEIYGEKAGAVRADADGEVLDVTPDYIEIGSGGTKRKIALYNNFPFNRKSGIHQTPLVQKGQQFKAGTLLARSNYNDKDGGLALGINARIGVVPYKGYSIDDSVVISTRFANKLKSEHMETFSQDFDKDVRGGRGHYVSLFPKKFTADQLEKMDEAGVVRPGVTLNPGDPMVLATKPRIVSSSSSSGKLSKSMRDARTDSSQIWEEDEPGVVTDVRQTKDGVRVVVKSLRPTKKGDKIVLRSGQKGIVSLVLPDDHVPRTKDGQPFDILLNPLGIPSRVNNSLIYEILLGKVANKTGKPYKIPGFNKPGEKWYDFVKGELDKNGVSEVDEVWDPKENRMLENPVTTGNAYVLKLHHTGASKISSRGQGSYDLDQQPVKGGGEGAQAKRLSGLETHGLLSAGAYATLREGATLRGQRNDDYWRTLRSGYKPRDPGSPFVWDKFQALLSGSGMLARNLGGGKLRLGPMTDKDLDERNPADIENGEMVDLHTLEPIKGGLFDPGLVGNNRWGRIKLPHAIVNPSMEKSVLKLLDLTEKEYRAILAGKMELPPHLR